MSRQRPRQRGSALLAAALLLVLTAPALAQPIGDYGDAPRGVVAYPSLGVLADFPTCYDVGGYYVFHDNPAQAWFGLAADEEPGGNGGPCAFPPYENDECWGPYDQDAGLMNCSTYTIDPGGSIVLQCGPDPNLSFGDPCTVVPWGGNIDILVNNLSGSGCYINVLIDWNRDGRWGGLVQCPGGAVAEEHVVQNLPVPDGYVGPMVALSPPDIQIGPDSGYFWVRFTISPDFDPVPLNWDGAKQWDFGETEDYLLRVGDPGAGAELGDAPEDVIAYPLAGVFGLFPTCVGGTHGHVIHNGNTGAWLGGGFDLEGQGNANLCSFVQYDNDECDAGGGDAGLLIADAFTISPNLNIEPCDAANTDALGAPCQRTVWGVDIDMWIENTQADTRWLNVVFDWDRNGEWGQTVTCANGDTDSEHALQDFQIPGGYVGPLSGLNPPSFEILGSAGYVWSRFTLSDAPVNVVDWDGQGSFADGETEDYLLRIDDSTGVPGDGVVPDVGLLLEPCFPNPFNPRTEIKFTTRSFGEVLATIHDATGRRVATVADQVFGPGPHAVTWLGRDDAGRTLPSGVYSLRVSAGGETRTQKLTIIK